MKLITVEATFAGTDVATAADAIEAQAATVKAMSGCDHYALYRTARSIAIVQRWTSMEAFDAYRTSETFAGLIGALKPIMAAPPVTTVASVDPA